MGVLYAALGAPSGPGTGLAVLVSGVVLIAATWQAARILLALQRAGQGSSDRTDVASRQVPASGSVVSTSVPTRHQRLLGVPVEDERRRRPQGIGSPAQQSPEASSSGSDREPR